MLAAQVRDYRARSYFLCYGFNIFGQFSTKNQGKMEVDQNNDPDTVKPSTWTIPTYWLSRTTIALAVVFTGVFVSITFYVSQLQQDLNEKSAIERAANLSEAVAAFRTLYTSEVVQRLKDQGVLVTHDYKEHAGAISATRHSEHAIGKEIRIVRPRREDATL